MEASRFVIVNYLHSSLISAGKEWTCKGLHPGKSYLAVRYNIRAEMTGRVRPKPTEVESLKTGQDKHSSLLSNEEKTFGNV
jgi:hypothetical protein